MLGPPKDFLSDFLPRVSWASEVPEVRGGHPQDVPEDQQGDPQQALHLRGQPAGQPGRVLQDGGGRGRAGGDGAVGEEQCGCGAGSVPPPGAGRPQ